MKPQFTVVEVPKSEIDEAITLDSWDGDLHTVDIPGWYDGSVVQFKCMQITIVSEDEPTSWAVAVFNGTGGTNSDLDLDAFEFTEVVTDNSVSGAIQTGVGYYSNSDTHLLFRASRTGTPDSPSTTGPNKLQMSFLVSPQGTTGKSAGASGEMIVRFWLMPITGY